MALTSIQAPPTNKAVFVFNRGNIGTLVDIVATGQAGMRLPALGGSCVYPSENDVRFGTAFGTIYTGNLTLPTEAEVESGVQYGASGVEYTGNLVGGGGEHSYTF